MANRRAAAAMKVLLVKMSSLGDLVHALPAVTEAASRQVCFHWVAEEAFAALPAGHPGVQRVLPIAWRRWRSRWTTATSRSWSSEAWPGNATIWS